MRKSIKQVLAAALASAVVIPAVAAPTASAALPERYWKFSSASSNMLIEVGGWSTVTGAPLNQWHSNDVSWSSSRPGLNQQWKFSAEGAGVSRTIRNRYSGLCITTADRAGRAVYQAPCTGHYLQLWLVHSFHSGEGGDLSSNYWFQNPATGLVLDVYQNSQAQGAPIVSWYPNGGANQTWYLNLV